MVEIKTRDQNGKQIYRSKQGITSERKAQDAEYQLKRDLDVSLNKEKSLLWKDWFQNCLETMRLEMRPSTTINYDKILNKWATPHWGSKEIHEITRSEVYKMIYEIYPAGNSPQSKKTLLKMIRRIFSMAVNEGILDRNPCLGLSVKAPEVEQKVLTNSEVEIFLREAKNTSHRFYPIWLAALMTGMRSGELYGLEWNDVDLEGQIIHINKQWTNKNGFTPVKNMRTRVVPISDGFLTFLKEYKLQKQSGSTFVLPHLKEWETGDQARVTAEFCTAIGITPVKFHDLRATFITNLLSRGVSLARVMSIVGHSQIKTTNGYLRKAGVEVKGVTNELGYEVPVESTKIYQFPSYTAQAT